MLTAVYPELHSAVLLCIGDNADVLECEKAYLESFGFVVLTAASGGKGLEVASQHSVDVVIVDYLMTKMNGQEMALQMKRLLPLAPIIMLSESGHVPEQPLLFADALIAKDRLDSQLLPAIAQLHARGGIPPPSYHA